MSADWCRWLPDKEHSPGAVFAHELKMCLRLFVICELVSCISSRTVGHTNNILLAHVRRASASRNEHYYHH